MKSKNSNPIRIAVMSGNKELVSFKGSNFDNSDEINFTLNALVNVITSVVISSAVTTLANVSDSGSTDDVLFAVNKLLDVVNKHTRDKIKDSLDSFSKEFLNSGMKGGNA